MSTAQMEQALTAWPQVAPALHLPRTEADYRELVALLDTLIDRVGEDEDHPHASLMEVLGVLIEQYENEHVPELN
jgi:HTH-type transcriptional regulator/antitoxin HigA